MAATVTAPPDLVELSQVERALAELRGTDRAGSVRATTLNLIVVCAGEVSADDTAEVLDRIGGSRPLRAFLLAEGRGRPMARVSSACWVGGGHEVCTERIAISGERAALPSGVAALLVADLPVFLWWQGPLPDMEDTVLVELTEMASQVIVDSVSAPLPTVEELDRRAAGLTDLAWVRTHPWREAIAALFDGRVQRRALSRLFGIEVSGPPNEAALLAGWLRSRLSRHVGLDAHRAKRLNRVKLLCGDDAVFQVERMSRNQYGLAGGPGLAERTVALPIPDLAMQLAEELDRLGHEPSFEESLTAAVGA
jgi:glucose-6-phosphate dehydrogenase assembly protein OpcA